MNYDEWLHEVKINNAFGIVLFAEAVTDVKIKENGDKNDN